MQDLGNASGASCFLISRSLLTSDVSSSTKLGRWQVAGGPKVNSSTAHVGVSQDALAPLAAVLVRYSKHSFSKIAMSEQSHLQSGHLDINIYSKSFASDETKQRKALEHHSDKRCEQHQPCPPKWTAANR